MKSTLTSLGEVLVTFLTDQSLLFIQYNVPKPPLSHDNDFISVENGTDLNVRLDINSVILYPS